MSISNSSVFPDIARVGFGMSRDERETIISRADDEQVWCVTTFSPVMARKLQKLHVKQAFRAELFGSSGLRCFLPVKSVSLHTIREISPEKRLQLATRMRERRATASEEQEAADD